MCSAPETSRAQEDPTLYQQTRSPAVVAASLREGSADGSGLSDQAGLPDGSGLRGTGKDESGSPPAACGGKDGRRLTSRAERLAAGASGAITNKKGTYQSINVRGRATLADTPHKKQKNEVYVYIQLPEKSL